MDAIIEERRSDASFLVPSTEFSIGTDFRMPALLIGAFDGLPVEVLKWRKDVAVIIGNTNAHGRKTESTSTAFWP